MVDLVTEGFALFDTSGVMIMGLNGVIDTNPSISHSQSVDLTPYPIEDGSSLTDNAVVKPDTLNIETIVSDQLISDDTRLNVPAAARAATAWGIIADLKDRREPVTVVTQLQTYENMLIVDMSAPQNRRTGRGLHMNIRMQEVLFASTQLVRLPPSIVAGAATNRTSTVNRGEQQSVTLSAEEDQAVRNNL